MRKSVFLIIVLFCTNALAEVKISDYKNYKVSNYLIPQSVKFLADKNIESILDAQRKATENIFIKKNIPFRTFYFLKKREEELGEIFTFFVLETILLSRLMKINPFNHPAVEIMKKDVKKIILNR